MIKTMLVDKQSGEIRCGDEGLLAGWADNESIWIWVDFDREKPVREAELFSTHFSLDPLVIADAQTERHPPKLEGFEDYFFLLLHGLDATTKDIEFGTIQIALFVGERFLVTRRHALSVSTDKAWTEAEQGTLKVVRGPAHVAYRIIRLVTERYTNIVVGLERRLDELEDEMFENPRDAILEELVGYSANLKKLRRIFTYHQDMFARLSRRDNPFVDQHGRHEFNDVFEHTERLASLSALFKELADDLMNGYTKAKSSIAAPIDLFFITPPLLHPTARATTPGPPGEKSGLVLTVANPRTTLATFSLFGLSLTMEYPISLKNRPIPRPTLEIVSTYLGF